MINKIHGKIENNKNQVYGHKNSGKFIRLLPIIEPEKYEILKFNYAKTQNLSFAQKGNWKKYWK
jgi:hypothetical protein